MSRREPAGRANARCCNDGYQLVESTVPHGGVIGAYASPARL
jgi:hypothetical protein